MAKKLYCVKVLLYVMAENGSEACVEATRAPFDIFECSARKAQYVDPDWTSAVPYNSDDERTCAEVLASEQTLQPAVSFLTASRPQERAVRMPLHAGTSPGAAG